MNKPQPPYLVWNRGGSAEISASSPIYLETGRLDVNPVTDHHEHDAATLGGTAPEAAPRNLFFCGDNHHLLQMLVNAHGAHLNLIYIDPPYMTNAAYRSRIGIGDRGPGSQVNRDAFEDRWPGGLCSYLDMLYPRLQLMRQLLAPDGSILVHVDWHASHYVRVLLDEIFGADNFVNEIAWCFGGGSGARRYFHRKHDLIYWYACGPQYIYNPQYRPYSPGTLQRGLTAVKGDRYRLHHEGALMQDWWTDIGKILSPTARENLKYPTQKPKELLKRLVAAASRPGDMVADFFAGSGTLGEVCNELGRDWIMCDSSKLALQTSTYRLIKTGSGPVTIAGEGLMPALNRCGRLKLKEPELTVSQDDDTVLIRLGIDEFQPAGLKNPVDRARTWDYIDFWEIDHCYDQQCFNSRFQVIRAHHRYPASLPLEVQLRVPVHHDRQVAVRVWDVFANQNLAVAALPL